MTWRTVAESAVVDVQAEHILVYYDEEVNLQGIPPPALPTAEQEHVQSAPAEGMYVPTAARATAFHCYIRR